MRGELCGCGTLAGLDIAAAIDLFTGYLTELGDCPDTVAGGPPTERLATLIAAAGGDIPVVHLEEGPDNVTIHLAHVTDRRRVDGVMALLAVCVSGGGTLTFIVENAHVVQYVISENGLAHVREGQVAFSGPKRPLDATT